MISRITIRVKVLLDRPVGELVKEDETTVVRVDLLEGLRRVRNLLAPALNQRHRLLELRKLHTAVPRRVDLREHRPQLEVVVQVHQQHAELGELDVVVRVRPPSNRLWVRGLVRRFGVSMRAQNDWLQILRDLPKPKDIQASGMDFSNRQVPVAVWVKAPEKLLSCLELLRRLVTRKLASEQRPYILNGHFRSLFNLLWRGRGSLFLARS